jgi:hypothetical protein
MKTRDLNHKGAEAQSSSRTSVWLTATALVFALPTAIFILFSILKYWMNINDPFDTIQPTLESWGIKEGLGFNINLLVIGGPIIGLFICLMQVLRISLDTDPQQFEFHIGIKKEWFALTVALFSAGVLAVLFFYMLGENCRC